MFMQNRCNLGVMLQLIEFCFEPLFRHPHCPEGFRQLALEQISLRFYGTGIDPIAFETFEQSMQAAEQRAERPYKQVTLAAEITFGSVTPFWSVMIPSALSSIQVE
ncbi:hypothetical protein LOY37_13075 [Pseudomonas sp. B21-012]|uniref:hypothetical protein n=1 Tax=Pseudomonas sp. B21-012 TaxID=2895472 RepID=UPI0021607BAF|nr:hypothetical protein [Pseudomonas sp. B21-012]UVM58475.1 hypothetical protein LOY37_13075 [Pseudomonas sp. B21-012]